MAKAKLASNYAVAVAPIGRFCQKCKEQFSPSGDETLCPTCHQTWVTVVAPRVRDEVVRNLESQQQVLADEEAAFMDRHRDWLWLLEIYHHLCLECRDSDVKPDHELCIDCMIKREAKSQAAIEAEVTRLLDLNMIGANGSPYSASYIRENLQKAQEQAARLPKPSRMPLRTRPPRTWQ